MSQPVRHDDALDALAMVDAAGHGDLQGLACLMEHADLRHVSLRLAILGAGLLETLDDTPELVTARLRTRLILGAG